MDNPVVVLDTNIYISATFWEGAPHRIVKKAADHEFITYISKDITKELKNVLSRDFNRNDDEIRVIVDAIKLFAKSIESQEKIEIIKDDPDDNRILECASACHANFIVTQDNHLLKLEEFKGIKILTPKEFLELLK